MITKEYFTLSNGVKIPKIGYGTWRIKDDIASSLVKNAIEVGYSLIDTAQGYRNERGVGEGIKESGVNREDLFIASKVEAHIKNYDDARASIDRSLEVMGLNYLDQIIIHSPQPWDEFRGENRYFKENIEVYKAIEDAYNEGKIRVIGVSNFLIDDLKNILENCKIKPMVNQVLLHISNTDFKLLQFCKKENILVEAYSPIAHGEILKDEEIKKMAEKYNVSVAQICIKYAIELGTVALPKTENIEHMKSNLEVDFEISKEDLEILKSMKKIENYGEYSKFPVFSGK